MLAWMVALTTLAIIAGAVGLAQISTTVSIITWMVCLVSLFLLVVLLVGGRRPTTTTVI